MIIPPRYWLLKLIIIGIVGICLYPTSTQALPVFGLRPPTLYKGGIGIELDFKGDQSSASGLSDKNQYFLITGLFYGITTDLTLRANIPVVLERRVGSKSSTGVGDVVLLSKYRFWRHDAIGAQDALTALVGVKLPTGKTSVTPSLGSGAFDFIMGLVIGRDSRRWTLSADIQSVLKTEGSNNIRVGHQFLANTAFGIRPWLGEYTDPDFIIMTELNWRGQLRSTQSGASLANSGGHRLFVAPGFTLIYRNWGLRGGVQIPIYQELNGNQRSDDYRFSLVAELHL
mgnify:CR=1 FL=1